MKNVLKLIFLAVALVACGDSLFAQKFAYINRAELIAAMPERDSAEKKMMAYRKDLLDQLEAIQVEFNKKYNDFQKSAGTLTDALRQLKETELQDLRNRHEEFQMVAQQDLQKMEEQLMTPIIARSNEAIAKVSKANSFIVVFELDAMPYIDKSAMTDLLPMVKKEMGIQEK